MASCAIQINVCIPKCFRLAFMLRVTVILQYTYVELVCIIMNSFARQGMMSFSHEYTEEEDEEDEDANYMVLKEEGDEPEYFENVTEAIAPYEDILWRFCRICGCINDSMVPIYDEKGIELQLEEKINNYLPITVSLDDELPLHMCSSCIDKLNITHNLIVSCLEANSRFCNYLQSRNENELILDSTQIENEGDMYQLQKTDMKPESHEVREVSEERPKVKKVVVLKLVHSKNKNLSPSVRIAKALEYLKSKKKFFETGNEQPAEQDSALCEVQDTSCSGTSNINVFPNKSLTSSCNNDTYLVQSTSSGMIKCSINNANIDMSNSGTHLVSNHLYNDFQENRINKILQQAESELVARSIQDPSFEYINAGNDPETCQISTSVPNGMSFQRVGQDANNDSEMDDKLEVASVAEFCVMTEDARGRNMSQTPKLESQISKVLGTVDSGTKLRIVEAVQNIVSNSKDGFVQSVKNFGVTCSDCGNTFPSKAELANHFCRGIVKTKPGEYLCKICNKRFKDMYKFTIHKQMHTRGTSFECGECGKRFSRRDSLQIHQLTHSGVKPFRCRHCDKSFLHRTSLEIHQASSHSDDKPWLCDHCGKRFAHASNLRVHSRNHLEEASKKRFQCETCGKLFRNRFLVREHAKLHTGERPFRCTQCPKSFSTKERLKQHEPIHLGVRPYQCGICSMGFIRKGNLTKHYKTHSTDKVVTCRVCKATFPSVAGLLNHRKSHSVEEWEQTRNPTKEEGMKSLPPAESFQCCVCNKFLSSKLSLNLHMRVHTGEKPYQCEVCNKRFTQKPALTYHKRLHTGERPHACQFCGKGFNSKVGKESHERIHTGERPYKCGQCGVGFRCSANLRQHTWIHTDNRPFVCEVCSKLFRRREALQVHMRIHTGERPYSCPICGRSFTQKGDMLKHTRSHSKKNTRTTGVACFYCGQVFGQKKHYKLHVQNCAMAKQGLTLVKEGEQEELVQLKDDVDDDTQEIKTVTITSDDIITTFPEITIVTNDIQEYEVEYQS